MGPIPNPKKFIIKIGFCGCHDYSYENGDYYKYQMKYHLQNENRKRYNR